jgi:magnesium transporter
MIKVLNKDNTWIENIDSINVKEALWIDLIAPTVSEIQLIENKFKVKLFTKAQREEIESSSRFIELEDELRININFINSLEDNHINTPISFIIKDNIIVSQRDINFVTFDDLKHKIKAVKPLTPLNIFINLIDIRVDYDADLIEDITRQISQITKELVKVEDLETKILLKISKLQVSTIAVRENIIEKQRVLSSLLKVKSITDSSKEIIKLLLKDIVSLLMHVEFNFGRLESTQDTFLGLVSMQQNKVIKFFTIMTVVFMPPTLIASIYGMNFKFMPELYFKWGYPFSIVIMILSSVFTLWYFKRKKWL